MNFIINFLLIFLCLRQTLGGTEISDCLQYLLQSNRVERHINIPADINRNALYPTIQLPNLGPSRQLDGEMVQFSRHHIIPASTLLNFFKTAMQNPEQQKKLLEFIEALMLKFQKEAPPDQRLSADITNGIMALNGHPVPESRATPADISRVMRELFVWQRFNLFWGPNPERRLSDPGNSLERNLHYIIGDAGSKFLVLYRTMMDYLDEPTNERFFQILNLFYTLSFMYPNIFEFDRSHWKRENVRGVYKYRLRDINEESDVHVHDELKRKRSWHQRYVLESPDPLCLDTYQNLTLYLDDLKENHAQLYAQIMRINLNNDDVDDEVSTFTMTSMSNSFGMDCEPKIFCTQNKRQKRDTQQNTCPNLSNAIYTMDDYFLVKFNFLINNEVDAYLSKETLDALAFVIFNYKKGDFIPYARKVISSIKQIDKTGFLGSIGAADHEDIVNLFYNNFVEINELRLTMNYNQMLNLRTPRGGGIYKLTVY